MTAFDPESVPTDYGVTLIPIAPPATEACVAALESELGDRLPEDYRRFLLRHNGGRVRPGGFWLAVRTSPATALPDGEVETLSGLHGGKYSSLEQEFRSRRDRHPGDVIPIADDAFGNRFCLVIHGDRRGQVWFWDHEREPPRPVDWSNMDLIAESFDAFMRGLVPVDD